MPDLDLHRDILMTYLADDKHRADQLFSSCNRSLKKTLQQYYTPDDSVETILDTLQSTDPTNSDKAIKLVDLFLHHHVPNDAYNTFLQWLKDDKIALDRETKLGLKSFKRVPRKKELDRFFQIIQSF